ncbi:hypothetical protein WG908_03205 [Sphingobium sp. AN641]|uniref:hypothetical protein n=1 Tax=Sphingobium sp. AN641 TaxID=3133443 RepID=UPI0030BEFB69
MKTISNREKRGRLPDPDGLNKECAARAKKTVELFCRLSGATQETAVRDLLHELMHLCDRDPEFGNFADELGWAFLFLDDIKRDLIEREFLPEP